MYKYIIRFIIAVAILFGIDYIISSLLKIGLDKGMGLNEHSQILIVGHSHLMMGLDKDSLEKGLACKVSKHTRSGVGIVERKMMTDMFINSKYSDSLKVVVIGVDPFLFNGADISQNTHTLFYPWMDEPNVGEYIKEYTTFIEYYAHKIFHLSRYSDDLIKQSIRGWNNDDRNYKTTVFTDSIFEANKGKWDKPIKTNPQLMSILEQTIKDLTERKIHTILLQTPILKLITDLNYEDYENIVGYYKSLDAQSDYVHFINYSPYYNSDYQIFFDPIHLNETGQKEITKRFIKDLKTLSLFNSL